MMQGSVVRLRADDEKQLPSNYSLSSLKGKASSTVINKRNMQNVVFFSSREKGKEIYDVRSHGQ